MKKRRILRTAGWLLFTIIAVIYIMPLVMTFTNSLMSSSEILRNYSSEDNIFKTGKKFFSMTFIPTNVTLEQYNQILFRTPYYLNMFWNSVKLTVPVVVGQLVVASMAAYAFTVLEFRHKEKLFFIYIIVMLLPLQVTLVPNYVIADMLGITDSYLAIILPGIFSPFSVFLLRQFMKMIPNAYIESAQIDGAGHLRIYATIVLPMIKAGIASAAMLVFVEYWNLIDQAVIFIRDSSAQPLSLFLAKVKEKQMGISFAASCFYVLPVLIILFYGQDYLQEGIGLSGIKG